MLIDEKANLDLDSPYLFIVDNFKWQKALV